MILLCESTDCIFKTRCEYIPIRSDDASLRYTVLKKQPVPSYPATRQNKIKRVLEGHTL